MSDTQIAPAPRESARLSVRVQQDATIILRDVLPPERIARAAARVGLAFASAISASKDPSAYESCSRASVAAAITVCALVDLMPSTVATPVWLIPKGGRLEVWISHRGLMELARRAGYIVRSVPVGMTDEIEIIDGDARNHRADPDAAMTRLEDLRGVYVIVTEAATGREIGRPWMSRAQIMARAAKGGPVWKQWPIEMARKTAIKAAVMRGEIPVSEEMQRALAAEPPPEPEPTAPPARIALPDLSDPPPDATEIPRDPSEETA